MLDVVARNQFGQIVDHALDAIGVEAPFVENLVGAVVALVGAAYAAGVGQLPYAGHGRIDAGVCQVICRRRQIVDVGHRPLGFVNDSSVCILE